MGYVIFHAFISQNSFLFHFIFELLSIFMVMELIDATRKLPTNYFLEISLSIPFPRGHDQGV